MNIFLDEVRRDAIEKFDSDFGYDGIVNAISLILEAATLGKKEGLLALEERFYYESCRVGLERSVSDGVCLICDAYDPELVTEMLTNSYWANNYTGNEALAQYCIIRGILLVQQGENPYSIERILSSTVPRVILGDVTKALDEKRKIFRSQVEAKMLEWYENWEGVDMNLINFKSAIEDFEFLIKQYDDKDIQRILREVDNADLELALTVLSPDVRNKILNNMSYRLRMMVLEDMQNLLRYFSLHTRNVERVLEKITGIIDRLSNYGDIQRLI